MLLGALVTLASFATDMGLPVLEPIAASLHVTAADAALTLSVFIGGFAIGPLAFGPVSDHYGRRPMLLVGLAMFALFGALGAFALSLRALLMWRFLMGSAAGGCQVLVLAMVRDMFTGSEARIRQSYVNLAAGVAPVVAPTLGVAVAAVGGWRAIYGVLAAGGTVLFAIVALRLGESATRNAGASLSMSQTGRSYARVLRHPVSLGYAFVIALNFGCLFAYVSGSSLVMIQLLGVSRPVYGYLFACTSLGIMAGALLTARLTRAGVPHATLIVAGESAIVGTALVLVVVTLAGGLTVWTLVPLGVIGFIGHGMVRPHASQGALEPMPDIAGVASAVLSGVQMIVGAAASTVVAMLFNGHSAIAVTGTMAVCATSAALVYVGPVRRAERDIARNPVELRRDPAIQPREAVTQ